MFDPEKQINFDDYRKETSRRADRGLDWSLYTVAELGTFLSEIRKHLPPLRLEDINVEEEILMQFHMLQELQRLALMDEKLPLNQRVQLANSFTSALNKMAEYQHQVYTSERIKRIEMALVRHCKTLPVEVVEAFMIEYEEMMDAQFK